jgi:eukaryotic-like serine/threonine-protein kinase
MGAGTLVLALLAAACSSSSPSERGHDEARCASADEIDGVWNDARAASLREAFARSSKPFAVTAATATEAWLDGYATRWGAVMRETCALTSVRPAQDQAAVDVRTSCLDTGLRTMEALVRRLVEEPTADVVENAPIAASRLAAPEECIARASVPARSVRPADPVTKHRLAALRVALGEVWAAHLLRAYDDAIARSEAVVVEATPLGSAPILAEARLAAGYATVEVERDGAALLEDAYGNAVAGHDDVVAAYAAMALAAVMVRADKLVESRRWLSVANERVAALPLGTLSADLTYTRGLVAERVGEHLEAADAFATSATGWESTGNTIQRGFALRHEAWALMGLERFEDALDRLRTSIALFAAGAGPDHPSASLLLRDLALVHRRLDQDVEAIDAGERAVTVAVAAWSEEDPLVASAYEDLASTYDAVGRWSEARDALNGALRSRTIKAPASDETAAVLRDLGKAETQLGEYLDAAEHLARALEIQTERSGDAWQLVMTLEARGALALRRGDWRSAIAAYRRAIALGTAERGERSDWLLPTRIGLARGLLAKGGRRAATEAKEVLALAATTTNETTLATAMIAFEGARARWALGELTDEILADATAAAALIARAGPRYGWDVEQANAWLAER